MLWQASDFANAYKVMFVQDTSIHKSYFSLSLCLLPQRIYCDVCFSSQIVQDVGETLRMDRLFWRSTDSGTWAALNVKPAPKCWLGSTSASECIISPQPA